MASGDGVYVTLGADGSELQVALAKAEEALVSLSNAVKGTEEATGPLADSTRKVTEQYDKASAALRKGGEAFQAVTEAMEANEITAQQASRALAGIEAAARKAAGGHEQLSFATAGARRELMVMAHEVATGNWTRFGPSLMVLAERMGGVSLATMGMAGAVAAAGFTVYEYLAHAERAEKSLLDIQTAFVAAGNAARLSDAEIKEYLFTLAQLPGVNREAAEAIITTFARTRQIGGETFQALTKNIDGFARLLGKDAPTAAREMAAAMVNPAEGAKKLDQALNFLTHSQLEHIATTQRENGLFAAQAELLGHLQQRLAALPPAQTAVESAATKVANAWRQMLHSFGESKVAAAAINFVSDALNGWAVIIGNVNHALSPDANDKYEKSMQRIVDTKTRLAIAEKQYAADPTDKNRERVEAWQRSLEKVNAEAVAAKDNFLALDAKPVAAPSTESGGDADKRVLADTDRLAGSLERVRALKSQIAELNQRAAATSDKEAAAEMRARAEEAQRQIDQLQKPKGGAPNMATWRAELAAKKEASDADQADQLREEVAFWEKKKELTHAGTAEAVQVEQAASHARIALKKEEAREEDAADKERQQITKIDAEADLAVARIRLAVKKDQLDEEVAAGRITLAQKFDMLRAEQEAVFKAEDTILAKEIDTLDKGEAAWEAATQKRRILGEQHQADVARLSADEVKAQQQAAQQSAHAWEQMLSPIERAVDTSIQGVVMGTQTLHQAVARSAQSVVAEEIAADTKWLAHKAIANAVGLQMDKSASQGGLLSWIISENSKTAVTNTSEANRTAATRVGAAQRDAADASGSVGFFGRIGQRLAEWLGLETSQTGATVAGTAARDTAAGTATAAAILAAKAQAAGVIPAYAAEAGAGAMASVAAIPYVGWAMAPEVGGETYADAMLYLPMASAAQGMERVPYDGMLVKTHIDESILPASYAVPFRDFLGSVGRFGVPAALGQPANSNQSAASSGGQGGGGQVINVTNNIATPDSAATANLFTRNGSALVSALRRQAGLGNSFGGRS